ncbi:MAG: DUF1800 domain-containing protein [Acidimicrobiales bacterium]|nr:DUF1800 domain-containing protein [Acidimicrobiales bacterium]
MGDDRSDLALLYRRAGFGLRAAELDQLEAGGYEAAVEQLVGGLGSAADPAGDHVPLPAFPPYTAPTDAAARMQAQRAEAEELAALQTWWMDRMIATSTPLRERLTLFWHGHFATGAAKVRDVRLMYLQNQLFRTSGASGFEVLVQGVAKDGAMMVWLDTITDKAQHPNENFARELMELFTLGIGNYTQADVTAAARAFTGWTYNRLQYEYLFRAAQHDYGTKTYLGQSGDWNGEDVVHIAVTRPESARFIVAKLWSHFAYPILWSNRIVDDLLPAYGAGLDIAAVLRALFLHPAFRSGTTRTGLVKQPVEYLAGAARALGLTATVTSGRALPQLATALGQTLFNPPNVGGWGQNDYWLDSATAQLRAEIALLLAGHADLGPVESVSPSGRIGAVAQLLGLDGFGPTTTAALHQVEAEPAQLTALALASPEFVLA